jgi:hypothetical protein
VLKFRCLGERFTKFGSRLFSESEPGYGYGSIKVQILKSQQQYSKFWSTDPLNTGIDPTLNKFHSLPSKRPHEMESEIGTIRIYINLITTLDSIIRKLPVYNIPTQRHTF